MNRPLVFVEPVDNIGIQEELLTEQIKKSDVPVILIINKIDAIRVD